jgi:hypothetical protein
LRSARRPLPRRVAIIVAMMAALALALQGLFVAASEAATGGSSHDYVGFAFHYATGEHHTHVVTHRHADGTVHTHVVDDAAGGLAKHVKQPGWNLAIVIGVVPQPGVSLPSSISAGRLAMPDPRPPQAADPERLGRPPRPPGMS